MGSATIELQEVADGVFACLQPDGSWGLSNAGLIVGDREPLLVDTFFDVPRTTQLLDLLRKASPVDPATSIVVNTHTNGDHCYGNALLANRRIISSKRARDELFEMPATKFHRLMRAAAFLESLGRAKPVVRSLLGRLGLPVAVDLIDAAPYVLSIFRDFDLARIPLTPPNESFEGTLSLELGEREVRLFELGPAHTEGDVVAFDERTRTLFAGDLLFMGCHPLAWAGTIESCIDALAKLLDLEPRVVVPGHGPVTGCAGIRDHIAYFRALRDEARPLFDAGATAEAAAKELMVRGFGARALPERLFVNVEAAYREFSPGRRKVSALSAMGAMSRLRGLA